MLSEEQRRLNLLAAIVSTARAVVTFEVALPQGCKRIASKLGTLKGIEDIGYPVFDAYMKATIENGSLPIGQERLHWDRAKLSVADAKLHAVNSWFEAKIHEACWSIIDKYGDIAKESTSDKE